MCSVLAGVGAALAAAGAGASMAAQKKADKAMQGAQAAETIRQREYQDQANKFFGESLQQATPDSQRNRLASEQAERAAAYEASVAPAQALPSLPTGGTDAQAPRVIGNELASALNKARRQNSQQAAAAAKLGGYDDLNLANAIFNTKQMNELSTLGNFARGSASVLPYEMQAASRKGDKLNNIGQLLSALGTVAGLGAAWSAPASAATAGTKGVASTGTQVGGQAAKAAASVPWSAIPGMGTVGNAYSNAYSLLPLAQKAGSGFSTGGRTLATLFSGGL